jgi:hypothetical protein
VGECGVTKIELTRKDRHKDVESSQESRPPALSTSDRAAKDTCAALTPTPRKISKKVCTAWVSTSAPSAGKRRSERRGEGGCLRRPGRAAVFVYLWVWSYFFLNSSHCVLNSSCVMSGKFSIHSITAFIPSSFFSNSSIKGWNFSGINN